MEVPLNNTTSTVEPILLDLELSSSKEKCNNYNRTANRFITNAYEGIPENLLLNLGSWIVLLCLFALMRKRAWDYGRLALVRTDTERWTRIFYGAMDDMIITNEDGSARHPINTSVSLDRGLFSWIVATFKIRDEHILTKCGTDAVQYLSFQRNVIMLVAIITLISVGVVLPINFGGDLEGGSLSFGHTTVTNLDPNSPWLWVHVTIAILYLPLSIMMMRRFSIKLKFEVIDSVSRTLMVTNIPRLHCDHNDITRHFREAYPEYDVQNIQLAYNIKKLMKLDEERDITNRARHYCEQYLQERRKRLTVQPYPCGYLFSCFGACGSSVDAIEYYRDKENKLLAEIEIERTRAINKPLGIVFVTMMTVGEARNIYKDYKYHCNTCGPNPPTSSVSHTLMTSRWSVKFAPLPSDIFWENLGETITMRQFKTVVVNSILFVVLFFLTTPAYVLTILDTLKLREFEKMNPILSEFAPSLLLCTFAALLPVAVVRSDEWLNHWTRSERNHTVMRKTFIFLLFMVLILPSLGLASLGTFIFEKDDQTFRWKCLFLPDKGAFFVNYVTTSALIGTALELIRFPELFMYAVRLALARSEAESASARKLVLWEFPFGVHYAWMMLIFAMTTVYSLSCPLITVFGLLYMLMKHFVDRYNIYFAYRPSKISQQIHATAINIVVVSVVLVQASFLSLSYMRRGLHDITIYSLIGFIITLGFFFAQLFLKWCQSWSPIYYQSGRARDTRSPRRRDAHSQSQYIPDVLRRGTLALSSVATNSSINSEMMELYAASPEQVDVTSADCPTSTPNTEYMVMNLLTKDNEEVTHL